LKKIPCPLNSLFRPQRLLIEPVNVCNYSCYKCLYPQMKREKTRLDAHKYETFLANWARRCGTFEEILFTGGGEALLHKDLKEITLISKKHMPHAKLTVGSNLALLTEERAKELIAAGLNNWEVSFDTVNCEEHLQLTGKDTFDTVVKNIRILWRALGEGSGGTLEVAAHRPFDKDYLTRIDEIERMVRGYCSVFRSAPYTTLMRRNLHPGLELFEETINYDDPNPVICLEPWDFLIVTADGSVRRCCSDMFDCPEEESLGNVFTQDIDEIIRNKKRCELQKKLAEHDIGNLYICRHCYALFKHTSPFIVTDKGYNY
jgi:MoaA/NifB/PqqE/SkfB family radical SAM enzyme